MSTTTTSLQPPPAPIKPRRRAPGDDEEELPGVSTAFKMAEEYEAGIQSYSPAMRVNHALREFCRVLAVGPKDVGTPLIQMARFARAIHLLRELDTFVDAQLDAMSTSLFLSESVKQDLLDHQRTVTEACNRVMSAFHERQPHCIMVSTRHQLASMDFLKFVK